MRNGLLNEEYDLVAVEKKLRLSVNGKELYRFYCSPMMIRELVTGFLASECVLKSFCAERMAIEFGEDILVDVPGEEFSSGPKAEAVGTSGCAGGVTFEVLSEAPVRIEGGPEIRGEALRELFKEFQARSNLYKSTGCVHSAALGDGKSVIVQAEDIGRHNAVDKVIGYSILEGIGLKDKILLTSGRLSNEITAKCARLGIPVLASRAAATSRAIDLAEKAGITLVGFLRGHSCNIYTHPSRILWERPKAPSASSL